MGITLPAYRSNRKAYNGVAIGAASLALAALLLGLLPNNGGETRAARGDAESTDVNFTKSLFDLAKIEDQALSFDLDPGKTTVQTLLLTNSGQGDANAHFGVAVTEFNIPDTDPAMDDTMVRVRDASPASDIDGTESRFDIEVSLREFSETGFISNRVISPGEKMTVEFTFTTRFDVNAEEWNNEDGGWTSTKGRITAFSSDIAANGVSDLTSGLSFDQANGLYTRPASDIAAALGVTVLPSIVYGANAASVRDDVIASSNPAYDTGARTQRVLLDMYGRAFDYVYLDEAGELLDGDPNNDGNVYDADGIRQFG